MDPIDDFAAINRKLWNDKTDFHLDSPLYDMPGFLSGNSSLTEIETAQLGDVSGTRILHLQCHFGQDSLSLARLGARVTGVDLSDRAIAKARELNDQLGLDARFICCNLYDLGQHLDESFDIVFASFGTIGWLPDLDRWAAIIRQFLRPGGTFHFAEFHPVVWMFDDRFQEVAYSYFNREPIIEETEGTYADRQAPIKNLSVSWNHPFGDVLGALLRQGLRIDHFQEYDFSPFDCFLNTVEIGPRRYQIKGMEGKLPMVYSLVASKLTEVQKNRER